MLCCSVLPVICIMQYTNDHVDRSAWKHHAHGNCTGHQFHAMLVKAGFFHVQFIAYLLPVYLASECQLVSDINLPTLVIWHTCVVLWTRTHLDDWLVIWCYWSVTLEQKPLALYLMDNFVWYKWLLKAHSFVWVIKAGVLNDLMLLVPDTKHAYIHYTGWFALLYRAG